MSRKYKFNKHGVCLTPTREVIFNNKKFTAIIFLAEKDGLWSYGYDFEIKGLSVGCFRSVGAPGFGQYSRPVSTKWEARNKAILYGISLFSRKADNFNVHQVIAALRQTLTTQLSLF